MTAEKRGAILDAARECVCKARVSTYGDTDDNFADIAELWTTLKGVTFTPHDVAMFMVCVKLARLKTSPDHGDSWVDIAGYAACGGSFPSEPDL